MPVVLVKLDRKLLSALIGMVVRPDRLTRARRSGSVSRPCRWCEAGTVGFACVSGPGVDGPVRRPWSDNRPHCR